MKRKSLIFVSILAAFTLLTGCAKSEENSELMKDKVSTIESTEDSVIEVTEETKEEYLIAIPY